MPDDMTGPERQELALLNARLFGLDGSGEEGAIGRIDRRLDRLEQLVNKAIGAMALFVGLATFLGLGGWRLILAALAPS